MTPFSLVLRKEYFDCPKRVKNLYGTAKSRIFHRTPAGYTAKKKTRRKRNRGCQKLLSVARQPLPLPPLPPPHTPHACCTAWGCVIRTG